MIGGKRFKTLREAKKYLAEHDRFGVMWIYTMKRLHPQSIYKYFVGSHIEWLNL